MAVLRSEVASTELFPLAVALGIGLMLGVERETALAAIQGPGRRMGIGALAGVGSKRE